MPNIHFVPWYDHYSSLDGLHSRTAALATFLSDTVPSLYVSTQRGRTCSLALPLALHFALPLTLQFALYLTLQFGQGSSQRTDVQGWRHSATHGCVPGPC